MTLNNTHTSFLFHVVSMIVLTALIFSCTFTKKIKDGTMAYELKQYSVATEMLSTEFIDATDKRAKARLAYILAESYWNMGEVDQALPWYDKAEENDFGPRAREKKAYALKYLEQYDAARVIFQDLLQTGENTIEYRREVAICKLAQQWKDAKVKKFEVQKALFNSRYSDYAPSFKDNNTVFFSSDRASTSSSASYKWTGRSYSDIYIYNVITGIVSHMDPVINTSSNEGTASLTADGTTLFFTRCQAEEGIDDFCKIMQSNYVGGSWTEPFTLAFIEEGINYGHPHWSEEQQVLFYSSNPVNSLGGFDLYFTRLDTMGEWSQPRGLPSKINTMGDEKFPSTKGDTLFFASDGHPGMGGLDIFYTYINKEGNWETPLNMKSPVNSGADDFAITFEREGDDYLNQGFFTSARNGIDNIFAFEVAKLIEDPSAEEVVVVEKEKQLKLAITVLVEDEDGNKKPSSSANVAINGKSRKLNDKGFIFENIADGQYELEISLNGHFSQRKRFTTNFNDIPEGKSEYTYNQTYILKPIIANKEIVLENILYDFNKSFIRDDAKPSLLELVSILKENPQIVIELSSHTDCRGPDPYNAKLSQERAEAAVEFIVSQGIDLNRIAAKGYGESQGIADCDCDDCTEEQHQENRRTSFKITGSI